VSDEDFDYEDGFFDLERRTFDAINIQQRENRNKLSDVYKWIKSQIDLGLDFKEGDTFSVFYVAQIFKKLEDIEDKIETEPYFETK